MARLTDLVTESAVVETEEEITSEMTSAIIENLLELVDSIIEEGLEEDELLDLAEALSAEDSETEEEALDEAPKKRLKKMCGDGKKRVNGACVKTSRKELLAGKLYRKRNKRKLAVAAKKYNKKFGKLLAKRK